MPRRDSCRARPTRDRSRRTAERGPARCRDWGSRGSSRRRPAAAGRRVPPRRPARPARRPRRGRRSVRPARGAGSARDAAAAARRRPPRRSWGSGSPARPRDRTRAACRRGGTGRLPSKAAPSCRGDRPAPPRAARPAVPRWRGVLADRGKRPTPPGARRFRRRSASVEVRSGRGLRAPRGPPSGAAGACRRSGERRGPHGGRRPRREREKTCSRRHRRRWPSHRVRAPRA